MLRWLWKNSSVHITILVHEVRDFLYNCHIWRFTQSTLACVVLFSGHPKCLASLTDVTPHLNVKTYVIPIVSSPKPTSDISKVSVAFFSHLKQNLMQIMLFFQVCLFLGIPKLQIEQHTLSLNKILLNNCTHYSLIPSRKWFSRLYFICT